MNRDRLAARLLATFLDEMDEQLQVMSTELLALEANPGDPAGIRSLFRVAHTLKGAARAAGAPMVEEVCHALETLLTRARDGSAALGTEEMACLFSATDALTDAGRRIREGRELADSPLAELARRLRFPATRAVLPARTDRTAAAPPADTAAPREREPGPAAVAASGNAPRHGVIAAPGSVAAHDGGAGRQAEQVRVPAEKLDALLASAGELLVATGHAAGRAGELSALHDVATRRAAEWRRGGDLARRALERTGAWELAGSTFTQAQEHLDQLARETGRIAAAARDDARALARLSEAIGERVQRLRLRPFSDACEALPRVVRDVAASAGRLARLEVSGGDVEADRTVIDGVREAVLHLVRNAVDHGIEPPEERERAGKPPIGRVSVAAALTGDRIVITVADDGAGLDVGAVSEQLERRGLPVPDDERELGQALFDAGFSTRAEVTAISGRGVGLDVAREAVKRIRGTVEVTWTAGQGTTFAIDCPLTLATVRVLLTRVGTQLIAVPTAQIEHLLHVQPAEIQRVGGREVITTSGMPIPLVSLARTLGPPLEDEQASGPASAIRLAAGERRLAVVVDELLSEQEVVVRPLERVQTPLPQFIGAAILGTGRVALVIDPAAVINAGLAQAPGPTLAVPPARSPARRRLLVVDDSITTRTLEQSILEAAGYEVHTGVDGAEGWAMLQEQDFDLVVSDVEMPGMDGFALCESIRRSPRHREIPVVLVTALGSPEHRARGLEAGANAYLVKSSFDQLDLLDTVRQLIGQAG